MARSLTSDQIALLQSGDIDARCLMELVLDSGTYYFCDDVVNLVGTDGNTYIGAAVMGASVDIVSSKPFSSESLTLTCDGTRMSQSGFTDPASLFREILTLDLTQRRLNLSVAFKYPSSPTITLQIPMYAGKINNAKVVDSKVDITSQNPGALTSSSQLQIQVDSLASRYQWVVGRTRSHNDQQEIDSTDDFFIYVGDSIANERNLYWGTATPNGISTTGLIQGVTGASAVGIGASNSPYNSGLN